MRTLASHSDVGFPTESLPADTRARLRSMRRSARIGNLLPESSIDQDQFDAVQTHDLTLGPALVFG